MGRRVFVLLFTLLTPSFHLGDCVGWLGSAEARMACCEDESQCPMHAGAGDHHLGSTAPVSQADADRCCAASEDGDSIPSALTVHAAVVALPPAVQPMPDANVVAPLFEWLTPEPSPPDSVARHVLLSTFLI